MESVKELDTITIIFSLYSGSILPPRKEIYLRTKLLHEAIYAYVPDVG